MSKVSIPGTPSGAAPAAKAAKLKVVAALVLFAVAAVIAYMQWPSTPTPGTELPPEPAGKTADASKPKPAESKVKYSRTNHDTTVVQDGEVTVERAGGGLVAPGSDPR